MSLLDVLRTGVKIADQVTKSVQATVSYQRVTARDAYGAPSVFAAPVQLRAVVDFKAAPVRTREGITTVSRATIDLLDVVAVAAATNGEGIDEDDVFILPDGSGGKILDVGGFVDAGTTNPIATTVMLG